MQIRQSIKDVVNWAMGLLSKPIYLGLSVLLFFTPLVISNDTNELFEFPKSYFIYFLGMGLFALALTIIVLTKRRIVWFSLPVFLFFAVNAVSTVFSVHTYTSFWGYYTRFNDGLFSLIVFLAIYFVCRNWTDEALTARLIKISALTVIPVSIVGIFQHYSLGSGFDAVDRVFSTFGQPNWLAQYLAMLLPIILYFAVIGSWVVWGVIFILGFACLWFTFSVSGILGFILAIILFFVVLAYKKILNKKSLVKPFSVLVFCAIFALANAGLYQNKVQDMLKDLKLSLKNISTVYAQSEDGHSLSDPGFIRLGLWKGALELFKSSPKIIFIGTGPETFPYAFQKFRPESLNYSSEWNYVFNKPHNYYLETLTETGIFGLAVYLWLIIKLLKKAPFYIIPAITGFLVTNTFGWPVTETALLFWIWLGLFEGRKL